MNLSDDYYVQRHLIAWIDANFVSVDAKARAYGEINMFLDEVAETGEDEYNYWLGRGWNVIYSFTSTRTERKETTKENV